MPHFATVSSARAPFLTSRLQGFGTTIFAEMTLLATTHKAVNLGQGFPDFDGPDFVKQAAIEAISQGHNQYCRSFGLPALNEAVAAHQQRFYGMELDPTKQVTVFAGATEAIFATLQAVLEVGDEVVVFEPFYDSYRASIAMAGAHERVLTLHAPNFSFTADDLAAVISAKTRAIMVNSPHNPTGRVFSRSELQIIADACQRHDLLAITDEVYEHLVFSGEHIPLATLPGMAERTITISSTGKTFSFTGWKIGFACASQPLTAAVRTAHQFITFCNGTPFQHAMAKALMAGDDYYEELLTSYRSRRDLLCEGLTQLGFGVHVPAGTYFVCTDIGPLGFKSDVDFCRQLPEVAGVAAIPNSAFYVNKEAGRQLVRFAFCKQESTIHQALERLRNNLGGLRP